MTAPQILDVATGVLLAIGCVFVVSGGLGVLRMPDFYTRIHAAGLTDSAGATFILLGLLLQAPDWGVGVRLVLIVLFMLLTGPTATHVLAQAGRKDNVHIWHAGEKRR